MFESPSFIRGIYASNIPHNQLHCNWEEHLVLLAECLNDATFSSMVDWILASISSLVLEHLDFLPLILGILLTIVTTFLEGDYEIDNKFEKSKFSFKLGNEVSSLSIKFWY